MQLGYARKRSMSFYSIGGIDYIQVTVTCICGNRKVKMVCSENDREYKSMATSRLASELHNLNSGGSVNISQIFSGSSKAERTKRFVNKISFFPSCKYSTFKNYLKFHFYF